MKPIILLLTLAAAASASTIVFGGEPTGVDDGKYYVLPYQLTIDGVSQLVTCYDTHDEVSSGDTWNANLLTLNQAAATGYFDGANALAGYERVAWLSVQSYSGNDQQIGLQHAIWNVFGSAPVTAAETTYDQAANAAAQSNYAGFNFSGFRFIEEVGATPGAPGTEQAFVFNLNPTSTTSATPEPGTLGLMLSGAALTFAGLRKRFKSVVS